MDVLVHEDPREFRSAIGDLYAADPVRHTLALTVIGRFLDDPAYVPVMLTAHQDGTLRGAAFRTPPWPLIVSGLPADAHAPVAAALAAVDPDVPGVNGPRPLAEEFARAWADHTGASLHEALAGRLYELGELLEPSVPGGIRRATEADLQLLVRWRNDFQAEALGHIVRRDRAEEVLRQSLARGDSMSLWEDGGEVVSWASAGVPIEGMSRVGPVYTPPARRGRGYGSASTAAASRWARGAGADHVLLFTDLANPTSNSIYQKIGYRPVLDTAEIEFTPAP